MEVLVNEMKSVADEVIVSFTTEFGAGRAFWIDKKKPVVNQKYNVELDISEELIYGKDIQTSKEKTFSINIDSDEIVITGILEKVWGDGVADLRFGKSLIQIEISGKNLPKGEYVRLRTDSLEMYNSNL